MNIKNNSVFSSWGRIMAKNEKEKENENYELDEN